MNKRTNNRTRTHKSNQKQYGRIRTKVTTKGKRNNIIEHKNIYDVIRKKYPYKIHIRTSFYLKIYLKYTLF
jgi:hypothetical protein